MNGFGEAREKHRNGILVFCGNRNVNVSRNRKRTRPFIPNAKRVTNNIKIAPDQLIFSFSTNAKLSFYAGSINQVNGVVIDYNNNIIYQYRKRVPNLKIPPNSWL